jgi:hypothetical protein
MLGLAGAGLYFANAGHTSTYGNSLEQYITTRKPQNSGDVDRLTTEYNRKVSRGEL